MDTLPSVGLLTAGSCKPLAWKLYSPAGLPSPSLPEHPVFPCPTGVPSTLSSVRFFCFFVLVAGRDQTFSLPRIILVAQESES